jgi:hypothetical protein
MLFYFSLSGSRESLIPLYSRAILLLPFVPDFQMTPTMSLRLQCCFQLYHTLFKALRLQLPQCRCVEAALQHTSAVATNCCSASWLPYRRSPKGATQPRFGLLYTSPLFRTSKNSTLVLSSPKLKLCALRIAAFCESVAASQPGLWACLGMVGLSKVLTGLTATRLFSRLLYGSYYNHQRRATTDDCAFAS